MKDFKKNFIQHANTIIEAMKMLDDIPDSLTLFVLDENKKLVGTLTDGDIRRGFIRGLTLGDRISNFMNTRYHSVNNNFSVNDFKNARDIGIRLLPVLDQNGQVERIIDVRKRKSFLPLEAVIMAGGRGKRLQPLTDSTPKPMLKLGNKPILEHNIDKLISYGIRKFYISVKYLAQQIVDYFGDGSTKGVSIEYIWEDKPLGTAGALSLIEKFKTKHILLMNSDLFTDADIEDLYLQTVDNNADIGIASVNYTVNIPYGILVEESRKVIGLKEKPKLINYANSGIYIIKNEMVNYIPKNIFFNITDLIELLIKRDFKIIHNPIVGYWIDIGQPQDYANAQEIVKHINDKPNIF